MPTTASRHRVEATGTYGKLTFTVRFIPDEETKGTCDSCGGRTLRSHKTGILHDDCYGCRHLKMIFGPNIKVTR